MGAGPAAGTDETIDFTKPGRLWANAQFEKDVRFHLVIPQAGYNKAQLTANPTINPMDDLIAPYTVPFQNANKDGMVFCDLNDAGRAQAAMAKIDVMIQSTGKAPEKIRAVYIATAAEGNRIPDARVVEVKDFKVIPIPSINLKGLGNPVEVKPHTEGTYITVKHFKAGKKHHEVELTAVGMKEVLLTTTPPTQIIVEGGPQGTGKLTLPVEQGKPYKIKVATLHKIGGRQTRKKQVPAYFLVLHPWSTWRTNVPNSQMIKDGKRPGSRANVPGKPPGQCNPTGNRGRESGTGYWDGSGRLWQQEDEYSDLWTGGTVMLRAAGTGDNKNFIRGIQLESLSFAADAAWSDGPPPPSLYHNAC